MKLPFLGAIPNRLIDERFLDHRRRSSTFAMMAGALLSGGLFEYDLLRYHRFNWQLAAVLLAMIIAKYSAFTWFRLRD